MEIKSCESNGRKLLVEFKCYRCKTTVTRSLKECLIESKECYRDLYDLRPPKEWEDGGFYYPLFCPDCSKAYKDFMSGKDVNHGCWVLEEFECSDRKFLICSVCDAAIDVTDGFVNKDEYDYCPYCGTRMDGDAQ